MAQAQSGPSATAGRECPNVRNMSDVSNLDDLVKICQIVKYCDRFEKGELLEGRLSFELTRVELQLVCVASRGIPPVCHVVSCPRENLVA